MHSLKKIVENALFPQASSYLQASLSTAAASCGSNVATTYDRIVLWLA